MTLLFCRPGIGLRAILSFQRSSKLAEVRRNGLVKLQIRDYLKISSSNRLLTVQPNIKAKAAVAFVFPLVVITGVWTTYVYHYYRYKGVSIFGDNNSFSRSRSGLDELSSLGVVPELQVLGSNFWLRLLEILIIFSPVILLSPFLLLIPKFNKIWSFLLLASLEVGGPMFLKLGQWASTRSDLFGSELRSSLSTLHSRINLEKSSVTERTLRNALEVNDLNELFLEFNEQPIGAGVMAQVHKATLLDGREVAVKIRRNAVKAQIERDLILLENVADFVVRMIPKTSQPFSIKSACAQFSKFMLSQLDLNSEYRNLQTFNNNFKHFEDVSFPIPIYASRDGTVLVETFEEGVTMSQIFEEEKLMEGGILSDPLLKKKIGRLGLDVFLKMAIVDNFCHSDLHPGNMLVKYSKNLSGKYNFHGITVLDAGLVTRLSSIDQRNFIDLFTAVATGNGKETGRLMIERQDPDLIIATEEQKQRFIEGMDEIVSDVAAKTFNLKQVNFGVVMQDVLSLVYNCQIPIDPNMSTLVISAVIPEGILRQLDSDLDIFKMAMPYIILSNREYKRVAVEKLSELFYIEVDDPQKSVFQA